MRDTATPLPGVAPVRCLKDISRLPPGVFSLPEDGRKWKHLQRERKEVAVQLATYADADGTEIYPAAETLVTPSGLSRATIFRRLDDLRRLGFLTDGEIHSYYKTRKRWLNMGKIATATAAFYLRPPVSPSQAPVSSSRSPVSKESETQPPYIPPFVPPEKHETPTLPSPFEKKGESERAPKNRKVTRRKQVRSAA